jgi:Abortive infection C-terminus
MINARAIFMQLSEAQASARQVLDAERHSPTTVYMMATPFANELAMMVSPLNPNLHPKPISEKPGALKLRSRNYELLESFYGEIQSSERGLFLGSLRERISARDSFEDIGHEVLGAGKTNRTNSELPLIGEFLVRHGDAHNFILALNGAPLRPGLTRLLSHLEQMIALDYRLFSDEEYDSLGRFAADAIAKLKELGNQGRVSDVTESNYRFHVCQEGPILCKAIAQQCKQAKYLRLAEAVTVRSDGRLEGIDSLEPNREDENFDRLASQVRSAIENGTPELGLDRLHTFALKYIRVVWERHFSKEPSQTATANMLLGEYANDLRQKGLLQSRMASEILKSSARVLDAFNEVRNNQTFAHDNEEIIKKHEAYFIYQGVAASIRFLESLKEDRSR